MYAPSLVIQERMQGVAEDKSQQELLKHLEILEESSSVSKKEIIVIRLPFHHTPSAT